MEGPSLKGEADRILGVVHEQGAWEVVAAVSCTVTACPAYLPLHSAVAVVAAVGEIALKLDLDMAFALIALIDCILCIENIAVQLLLLLTWPSLPSHCLIKTHLGFLSYHRSHVQLIPFQVWHLVSP